MRVSVPEKVLRVALGVALVFMLLPINTGNRFLDQKTHDEAEAAIPIVPVAIIFGTALAAYGVYAAGTTTDAYNSNINALYDGYVSASGMPASDVEAMLSASVTSSGTIDLNYLTEAGFFGLIPSVVANMVDGGTALTGESSAVPVSETLTLDGSSVPMASFDSLPYSEYVNMNGVDYPKFFSLMVANNSTETLYMYVFCPDSVSNSINVLKDGSRLYFFDSATNNQFETDTYAVRVRKSDGEAVGYQTYDRSYFNLRLGSSYTYYLSNGFAFTYDGSSAVGNANADIIATVKSAVLDGTAALPTTTVEPFEPTAEQLEAGYTTADIVEAINSGTGEISGDTSAISAGVSSIEADVASIESIWSGLQATPFGWLASFFASVLQNWTSLLDMLGSTPLSTLLAPLAGIGTIAVALTGAGGVLEWMGNTTIGDLFQGVTTGIAGVAGTLSGIDDWLGTAPLSDLWGDITGIATGVTGVLAGVNDVSSWWGTLSGWWEGLNSWLGVDGLTLEGVLEGVLSGTLAGTLADVIAAIQTGVLDIAGAIEGIRFPDPPRPDPEPGTDTVDIVGLPTWPQASIDAKLEEKAPFCYVVAMNQAFDRARGTYNDNPSFYYELNVPFAGDIRFDAGPWLNYSVNGFTIAWLLRVAFNAFMIALLLTFVYKGMQRVLSGD